MWSARHALRTRFLRLPDPNFETMLNDDTPDLADRGRRIDKRLIGAVVTAVYCADRLSTSTTSAVSSGCLALVSFARLDSLCSRTAHAAGSHGG
jgi:hypothetical protein